MRLMTILIITGLFLTQMTVVHATEQKQFSCGKAKIELGMTPEQIKLVCGKSWKPSYISEHHRPSLKEDKKMDHFIKWMYKTGTKTATHILIKNGKVVRIFQTP